MGEGGGSGERQGMKSGKRWSEDRGRKEWGEEGGMKGGKEENGKKGREY